MFTAHYFLNPSNASVLNDASLYNYINVKDVAYTRAAAAGPLTVKEVSNDEGYVTVRGTVADPSKIKDIQNDEQVTVLALQYVQGDSIVTSDFAALRTFRMKDFIINKVEEQGKVDEENTHLSHLYLTATEAVANMDMLQVTYNDAVGVCLNDWINIHADINGTPDKRWGGQKTINESGYKMKYELIGYKNGEFFESKYAKIENDTIKALDPATGKTPEVVSVIGRTPLLRVTLIDTNDNNKVVAAGYMKVKIVGESSNVSVELNTNVDLACGDEVVINKTCLTSQQVIDSLMSEAAFQNFHLVTDAAGNAIQYTKQNISTESTTPWGVVKSKAPTADDKTYLTITVKNGDAYAAFSKATEKSVIVRYTDGSSDVFVTITVKNPLLVKPEIDLADSKVVTTWFKSGTLENGTDELHAHVNEGTSASANWNFKLDDANWRIGNKVAALANVIEKQMDVLSYGAFGGPAYRFITPTVSDVPTATLNRNVKISVSTDGSKLYATDTQLGKQLIAELNTATGEVQFIGYDKNEPSTRLAGEVLNAYDHKALNAGETFTARVGIEVVACDPIGKLNVKNGEFDIKFLRPITFENANADIIDADPTTYGPKVKVSFVDWRDWTPNQFKSHTGNAFDTFYGLEEISMDANRPLRTNFATGGSSDADFVAIDAPLDTYFALTLDTYDITTNGLNSDGTISLQVNYNKLSSVTIHKFQAKIPVILKYKWGELASEITVTIKPTTGGNAIKGLKK